MTALLVAVAGGFGVLARWGIGRAVAGTDALIWSTVAINVAGSFLLGVLAAESWFSRDVREAIGVGFLGGFTTFSTFSVQLVLDVDGGAPWRAAAYFGLSVGGGIAAATLGYVLGRRMV